MPTCCLALVVGGANAEDIRFNISVIVIVSVRILVFLASLVRVVDEVRVSESVFTLPRILATVELMAIDSGVSARFLDASLDNVLGVSVIVSISVRIFDRALVTVLDMVIVSVRLLTMLAPPDFILFTASTTVIV